MTVDTAQKFNCTVLHETIASVVHYYCKSQPHLQLGKMPRRISYITISIVKIEMRGRKHQGDMQAGNRHGDQQKAPCQDVMREFAHQTPAQREETEGKHEDGTAMECVLGLSRVALYCSAD